MEPMDQTFKDHFSGHANVYARYRPGYPDALFAYLAAQTAGHDLAWDCGTGSGQAAVGLARHYRRVVATDASARQIEQATPHPHVAYRVAPAETAPLDDASADLVTVAQALHWFDFDRFYAEVRRVLVPGGLVAVWSYGLFTTTPAVDAVLQHYYADVVGPYWPPERRYFDEGYETIPFPFTEQKAPSFALEARWSLQQVEGFLSSWSATQRYRQQHGRDPLDLVRADLAQAWGAPEATRHARWPLHLRLGRPG